MLHHEYVHVPDKKSIETVNNYSNNKQRFFRDFSLQEKVRIYSGKEFQKLYIRYLVKMFKLSLFPTGRNIFRLTNNKFKIKFHFNKSSFI